MNLPSVEHNACLPISPAADVEQDGDDLLASGYGMQQASPWVVRYPCTNCSQVSPKGISEAYAGSSHETVTASVTTYVTPFVTGTPWIAAGHDVAMVPPVSVFTNESAAGRASDLVAGSESAPTSRRTGGRLRLSWLLVEVRTWERLQRSGSPVWLCPLGGEVVADCAGDLAGDAWRGQQFLQ